MQIRLLTTPWQRAWGAMFRRSLGETVLIFVYPHPAARSFHTYFCPPLRIVAWMRKGKLPMTRWNGQAALSIYR